MMLIFLIVLTLISLDRMTHFEYFDEKPDDYANV